MTEGLQLLAVLQLLADGLAKFDLYAVIVGMWLFYQWGGLKAKIAKPFVTLEKIHDVVEKIHEVTLKTHDVAEKTYGVAEKTYGMAEKTYGMAEKTYGMTEKTYGMAEKIYDVTTKTYDATVKTNTTLKLLTNALTPKSPPVAINSPAALTPIGEQIATEIQVDAFLLCAIDELRATVLQQDPTTSTQVQCYSLDVAMQAPTTAPSAWGQYRAAVEQAAEQHGLSVPLVLSVLGVKLGEALMAEPLI